MDERQDQYFTARGGYSRMLALHCAKCDNFLSDYQKDGPYGLLRRFYHDRIYAQSWPKHALGHIATCPTCSKPVAAAYTYAKENRPCWLPIKYSLRVKPRSYTRSLACFIRGLPRTLRDGI